MPLLKRTPTLVVAGVLAFGAAVVVQTTAVADDPAPPPLDYDASPTEVTEPPTDPMALLATPVLEAALAANFQQAIEDCVERTGFEYEAPAAVPQPAGSAVQSDAEVGYGVTVSNSPAVVEAGIAAEEEAREANLEYAESLPDDDVDLYLEVIGEAAPAEPLPAGEPANCQQAAAETVLEPAMAAQVALAEESIAVAEAVQTRPDVVAATSAWSSCMRSAGHHYTDPGQPEQEILSAVTEDPAVDLDALLAEERALAVADLECRESTGLTETVQQAAVQEWRSADIDIETVNTAAGAVQ